MFQGFQHVQHRHAVYLFEQVRNFLTHGHKFFRRRQTDGLTEIASGKAGTDSGLRFIYLKILLQIFLYRFII